MRSYSLTHLPERMCGIDEAAEYPQGPTGRGETGLCPRLSGRCRSPLAGYSGPATAHEVSAAAASKILGTESFPATAAGYRQLLVWARKLGTVRRAGVEGTGTFGAGLSRYLLAQQIQVFEVNVLDRSAHRLLGKSDPLDAQAAARAVLSGRARARAKSGDGPVHSARIFKLAKDSAVKARTQAINQLKAVPVIADPALREQLSSLGNRELFRTCARLGPGDGEDGENAVAQATHMTLRMLAERIEQLTGPINELNQRLTQLVERHAPQLLEPVGIGPDSAVTLLITMGGTIPSD